MTQPQLVTARTEEAIGTAKWPDDYCSSSERLDPYKHIGLIRSNQDEEILKAIQLLQRNGYEVYRRK